jgi:hypothetical protein
MDITDLSDKDKEILRDVLYEQKLVYPAQYTDDLLKNVVIKSLNLTPNGPNVTLQQQNGQLMGSILSFPVLCVANMLCYVYSLEHYLNHKVNLYDIPVIINGDDILFRANDDFYAIWLETIKIAGFTLSIGKNYIHPTVFTINSVCYSYYKNVLKTYGYLNVGLITGQSKLGRMGEKLPLWDIYNKSMYLATDKLFCHNRFMHYHKALIGQLTKKGNIQLFFPRELGGLGFDLYPEIPHLVTRYQHQLANFLTRKLDNMAGSDYNSILNRSVRLVQTNVPLVVNKYQGESSLRVLPNDCPLLPGYEELSSPESLLLATDPHDMDPLLSYKYISTNFLKEFRIKKVLTAKSHFKKYLGEFNRLSHRIIIKYDEQTYHSRLASLFIHPEYCIPCMKSSPLQLKPDLVDKLVDLRQLPPRDLIDHKPMFMPIDL